MGVVESKNAETYIPTRLRYVQLWCLRLGKDGLDGGIPALSSLFCVLGMLLIGISPAMANTCDICFANKSGSCDQYCASVPSGKVECHQFCMRRACGKACATSSSGISKSVDDEVTDCQTCVEYMKRNTCVAECRSSERRGQCVSRCAKFKCSQRCRLPVGAHPRERQQNTMSCTECRDRSKAGCRQRCGDKTRPGFTSCEVSCVEKRCMRSCNPDLF